MNKITKTTVLKIIVATSGFIIIGLIMSTVITSCGVPCPDGTEDTGVGRCVKRDEY